jgi:hypothetical protein
MYDTPADVTGVLIGRVTPTTSDHLTPAQKAVSGFCPAHAGDQRLPRPLDLWTAVYQAIDD